MSVARLALRRSLRLVPRYSTAPKTWAYAAAAGRPYRAAARAPILALSSRHNYTTAASLKACPNCGEQQNLESLSCPKCSTLQPLPMDIDFYKMMDLDIGTVPRNGWDVNEQQLKRVWRLRMAITHPDRMAGRSEVSWVAPRLGIGC